MPLYKVALRMAHDVTWPQRRKWSTTFYVNAATALTAAQVVGSGWEQHLRNAVDSTVFAYEVYATDLNPASDDYVVLPITAGAQRGLRAGATGDKYLLKAVVAVDLRPAQGRPSRKFWRFGLYEGDVVNGVSIIPAIVSLVEGAFRDWLLSAGSTLVDPDDQQLFFVGKVRLTTREFGRTAGNEVPSPPVG